MENIIDQFNYSLLDKIGSPCHKFGVYFVLNEIDKETKKGKNLILLEKYLKLYGDKNLSSNIIIPIIDYSLKKKIIDLTIINNPNDVERITENHLKKMPNLKPYVFDSIISTTDNDHWKNQRMEFQKAFSMQESLKPIIPISDECAYKAVGKLWDISDNGRKEVNINEFFLNETHLQLQKAMFGFSDNFEKKNNKKIRDVFSGHNKEYKQYIVKDLLEEINKSDGPLSKSLKSRDIDSKTKLEDAGNALIFSFAGHDTTGNTLTWLIYEISKNNLYQTKLQYEVDQFWLKQNNNEIQYSDFKRLPFMTRCIMETLRLRTPLPNGTFRELENDEIITGLNNQKITLPKGSYVQIPNIFRHLNSELWGNTSREYNPEREFKDEELWNNTVINLYNPGTERFSPFTYGPRDCIGKNFSQIEMRLLLLHLLRHFNFSVTEKQLNTYNEENMCFNSFTMGPRNIYNKNLTESNLGMYINVSRRNKNNCSKL